MLLLLSLGRGFRNREKGVRGVSELRKARRRKRRRRAWKEKAKGGVEREELVHFLIYFVGTFYTVRA